MNKKLYHKFITNSCTKEELLRIFILFGTEDTSELNNLIYDELTKAENSTDHTQAEDHNTLLHVKANLNQYISSQQDTDSGKVRKLRWGWIKYAAILIAIGFAGYAWFLAQHTSASLVHVEPLDDVVPLNGTAYIQLANNKSIPLRKDQQLIVDEQSISYANGEQIDEALLSTDSISVITPAGSTYTLQLSDGTKVWLNAKSKITYPRKWGNERRVNMQGELYFEVAHDKTKPFFVTSGTQEIRVLGTAFNVNAYPEMGMTRSTLIKGSIALTIRDKNTNQLVDSKKLIPGQEAIHHLKQQIVRLQKANTKAITAWKNNVFYFNNTPLEELMSTIERWYDVEVIYQNANFKEVFNGEIERSNSLKELMQILEQSGLTSKLLRIDGKNTIVVSNKNNPH
ncbi:FecR family protein [Sphingobacterium faecale]|uniref:FecR domain-containing protein n=1 Tax=Sphingobacterium faecale TaxID=2803775 RepID=A0ABS1R7X1_9SPHI|nr:FecR family protein [Sphingobacterium faecale]MBL1410395.1 FecR domain-containing protein [Sphingobacterium faecale]